MFISESVIDKHVKGFAPPLDRACLAALVRRDVVAPPALLIVALDVPTLGLPLGLRLEARHAEVGHHVAGKVGVATGEVALAGNASKTHAKMK